MKKMLFVLLSLLSLGLSVAAAAAESALPSQTGGSGSDTAISGAIPQGTSTRYIKGSGCATSGIISIPRRMNVLSVTNTDYNKEKQPFCLIVHYITDGSGATSTQVLVDITGSMSGEVIWERLGTKPLYFQVISGGSWSVEMGYGDEPTLLSSRLQAPARDSNQA